jgi:hypothetical protein
MTAGRSKRLLVEGVEDQYAVASLMSAFVRWGNKREEWPVLIEPAGSVSEMLAERFLPAYLKRPALESAGILLDANDSMPGRWQRIRQLVSPLYPNVPGDLPSEGLVHEHPGMPRLGVWIMPDNSNKGMLETFLSCLVPAASKKLWEFTQKATTEAVACGAPYKAVHKDKAEISAWLAWQDPPGQPFGEALKCKCLDPKALGARAFVDWFVKLFGLEGIRL